MENAVRQNLVSRRYTKNKVMMTLSFLAAILGIFFLSVILVSLG